MGKFWLWTQRLSSRDFLFSSQMTQDHDWNWQERGWGSETCLFIVQPYQAILDEISFPLFLLLKKLAQNRRPLQLAQPESPRQKSFAWFLRREVKCWQQQWWTHSALNYPFFFQKAVPKHQHVPKSFLLVWKLLNSLKFHVKTLRNQPPVSTDVSNRKTMRI